MKTDDIDFKVREFSEAVSQKIYGDGKTELQFYMTEACDLRCPGCYRFSGATHYGAPLPSADIREYVNQFKAEPTFNDSVCFSGGEVFGVSLDKLESDIRYVLGAGCTLQVKTNGTWVKNPQKADQIFKMLRGLSVGYGISGDEEDFKYAFGNDSMLRRIPKWASILARMRILYRAKQNYLLTPKLSLCMSVDNMIHPTESADWYLKIAERIGGDKKLRRKVACAFFCFQECADYAVDNILNNASLDKKILKADNHYCKFLLNGVPNYAFFGYYKDMGEIVRPDDLADISCSYVGGYGNRTVWFFHPNQTVSFEADLIPVGRVSYLDKNGKYKSVAQLRDEMAARLVADYKHMLMR